MSRTFIIAEAGVNHNGDLDLALRLVDAAADAGADAVKFQTFRAAQLVSRAARQAAYQVTNTGKDEGQLAMLQRLELSEDAHRTLIARARARGIAFLSTPFDPPSLTLLTEAFGLPIIKIPSGEITNAPFLLAIAHTGRNAILSTGASSLGEVEQALQVLAFGYSRPADAPPSRAAFAAAYADDAGRMALAAKVRLLHCTSEYPAPVEQVNLRAMSTLAQAFALPVGLSDHTVGIHIPIAAVACGASIIEKHFTLDRGLPGPDHPASLEPDELAAMVKGIREVELALGDGIKRPQAAEIANRDLVRKSLVATRDLAAGERIGADDLACKRPGSGISPFEYWERIGQAVTHDTAADTPLLP